MSIKDELKLIKEKCPIIFERYFTSECPNNIDENLINFYETNDYVDGKYCDMGSEEGYCEKCWNIALGIEVNDNETN